MSHGDRVTSLPTGFNVVGVSDGAPFAAIADDALKFMASVSSRGGPYPRRGPFENFTHIIAGCADDWTMAAFKNQEIVKVREQVKTAELSAAYREGTHWSWRSYCTRPLAIS